MGRRSKTPKLPRVAIDEIDIYATRCHLCDEILPEDLDPEMRADVCCRECFVPEREEPIYYSPWVDDDEQRELRDALAAAWMEVMRLAKEHFRKPSRRTVAALLKRALEYGAAPTALNWYGFYNADWDLRESAVNLVMRIDEGQPTIERFFDSAQYWYWRQQRADRYAQRWDAERT